MEERKWLPADTRTRLIDLCKEKNISQAKLASVIGVDRSALSRFISGKTDSLSHEHVIRIAKYFNVSTDFLLGETDDPGRINYDIGELGLTVQAAECLYSRKVDPEILCKLLEHERCGDLMRQIGLYLDDSIASGIAAQNQVYNMLSGLLNDHAAEHPADKQATTAITQDIQAMRQPLYTEKDRIHSDFDRILLDIKKDGPQNAKQAALMTKETMQRMVSQMKKGSEHVDLHQVTPEMLANSVLGLLNMSGVPESNKPEIDRIITRLRENLIDFYSILSKAKEEQTA